ncbi:proton-conducting transporter membrane subunit [Imperialibacter roseus]|uniref:Probable inorganic carbon transporter subunit DabB n=1 Tax=Imperialibacter roseus TaxID=1324217 RepID=A0ABZ0IUF8_9BACT|nr:proton-conducting transporter membrane subunit [Imperialibacter roseus]WOK07784.1 proton-conducting transporter membrane subunit [Imperialibacter roseus]
MPYNFLIAFALLPPAAFVATALASWFQPGIHPALTRRLGAASTMISIMAAAMCGYIVFQDGLFQTDLVGWYDLGFSLRLDVVSAIMVGMIALLGFVIFKFSINYLDGDQRQGAFLGRLAATIASVQLLVMAGNLALLFVAWVLTSVSLHRLLVFYNHRAGAIIAARKKFIVARLADVCLLVAFVILYNQFGSGNLETIFTSIRSVSASASPWEGVEVVAIFLAMAAILKSAQFPTHGWLIEVMETPTPVSALLHAGLLNAGPFLIIRMAYVMDASKAAPLLLMAVGGITALFASVAYLTQPSVKTALGYSSVAHMGFSLMVCGMGVYPAAMLHLVAHSFYKAHSFLSSGSAVDLLRMSKIAKLSSSGNPRSIALGLGLALALYSGFAILWGIDPAKDFSLLAIGAVITMGLSKIFVSAIEANRNPALMFHAISLALLVTLAFFTLESAMHSLLLGQVPEVSTPGFGTMILTGLLLLVFASAVIIQMVSPKIPHNTSYYALAIHFRNGFYANALFDRLISSLRILPQDDSQPLTQRPLNRFEAYGVKINEQEEELNAV